MRRCDYCNKLYMSDFKNCPLCGKHTVSWEPVQEKEKSPTPKEVIEKILSFMMHMGE